MNVSRDLEAEVDRGSLELGIRFDPERQLIDLGAVSSQAISVEDPDREGQHQPGQEVPDLRQVLEQVAHARTAGGHHVRSVSAKSRGRRRPAANRGHGAGRLGEARPLIN
jgi:hypothetical protein